jgi:hypothetical protein
MVPGRYQAELQGTVYSLNVNAQGQVTVTSAPKGTGLLQSAAIVSQPSGKCLDVAGGSTADKALVQLFGCHGGPNQQWSLSGGGVPGSYQIVNRNSGKCLDVPGGSAADGVGLQQYTCNGGANQQWSVATGADGYAAVTNVQSKKCVDIAGGNTADGAKVQQFGCHGGPNQKFRMPLVLTVVPKPTLSTAAPLAPTVPSKNGP